jgi:hypothetical protein
LNISFIGLKGNDSRIAKLVSKHSNLHVFLGLQCKYVEGKTRNDPYDRNCTGIDPHEYVTAGSWITEDSSPDQCDFSDGEETDTSYFMDTLSDIHGAVLPVNLSVDDFHEDLDAIFFESATKSRVLPAGNEASDLEKWYYSACLMITPKDAFYPFLARRKGFELFLDFISSCLYKMKCNMDLLNVPLPRHGYDSFIDSALTTQTSIDLRYVHRLLSLHMVFDFPKTLGHILDFLFDIPGK